MEEPIDIKKVEDFDKRKSFTLNNVDELFNEYINIDFNTKRNYLLWNLIMNKIICYLFKTVETWDSKKCISLREYYKLRYEQKKYIHKIKLYDLQNKKID